MVSCHIYIPYILLQQEPVDKQIGWWPVDKPEYMACGQTWICGLWTNLDMWPVEKPGYVACGQTWVHSLYSNLNM